MLESRTPEEIKQDSTESIRQQILKNLQEMQCKLMQNNIAKIQGRPVPYPELTEEYRQKKVKEERNTWMYGYGVSFQDDREQQALQEGKLIF